MASNNGFPPIIGTYNGINYYMRNGKQCQRKAGGGFTSESIKNNPNMQGIRNRNIEMAHCSKFTMKFKDALFPFLKEINDGTLHERVMKLFMKIRTFDDSPDGNRTVIGGLKSDIGRDFLTEFKFTGGPDGQKILGPVVDFNKTTGTLKATSFDPERLKFPKGSTHFSIDYGVLEYEMKTDGFRFILNEESLMVAKGDESRELVLEVPEKPKRGKLVFGIVKVQFYQKVGDGFYKSFAKGGVGIGVF